jgi:hypothetical protein
MSDEDKRADYMRARDVLLAVRQLPEGGQLACALFDALSDESHHADLVALVELGVEMLAASARPESVTPRKWRRAAGVTARPSALDI